MELTTLIGYYADNGEARLAFQGLAAKGCRDSFVLIHKGVEGETLQTRPSLFRCPSRLVFAVIVCALLTGVFPVAAQWFKPPSAEKFYGLPFYLSAGSFALLACLIWLQQLINKVETDIVTEHLQWLLPGESALILQAPVDSLHPSATFLRQISDIPPLLFVFHPRHERRSTARRAGVLFSPSEIAEHAIHFARRQKVDSGLQSGAELLKRLEKSSKWVRAACADLAAARRLEQKATLAADWILDNEYILERNTRDVLHNLPQRYYRQLPVLVSEPNRGMPYIYGLAKNLVSHTELHLDRENILAFFQAYQTEHVLTIGELWAIPQMLRIALVESIQNMVIIAMDDLRQRQLADFWANRLIAANQQDSKTLFSTLAELSKKESLPSPYFSARLVGQLYDEPSVLSPVQSWLERAHNKRLHDLNLQEQKRQTREQMSCANAFTSLRQLALLDWREMFEMLSRVEQILRTDPSGNFSLMDFNTRDRCRQAVEELARNSAQAEEQIARGVLKLAVQSAQQSTDELRGQVSYWLIGEGRTELAGVIAGRERLRYRILAWIYNYHAPVYLLSVGSAVILLTAVIVYFGLTATLLSSSSWWKGGMSLLFILLTCISVSQLAIETINYFVMRFMPARCLPKMDFQKSGIPDQFRTLVVVPVMLADRETIEREAEKLEIRYLANKETNLLFSLFSDYTDADTPARNDDNALLQMAVSAVEEMNARHGNGVFFLFHRERSWSDSEQKYIGWERKRGKLEELNSLIDGTRPESAPALVHVGDPRRLDSIRFVITLDSDTSLPHSSARRLVETLAHPLNEPRFNPDGTIKAGSYTIIQPRVSPTLESASRSLFSRLFSDPIGVDPYSVAISDVYQDLSGEGIYHGKGIYDVRTFNRLLSGRFPKERILSHDLIEGAYVRVGLASDIELFDDFPDHYKTYSNRTHRWVRGDWQIASWLLDSVPLSEGGYERNPLSAFSRWKIFDNLRRSLVPFATVGLLASSWLISPRTAGVVTLAVGLQLLFHALSRHFTMATNGKSLRHFSLSKLLHDLLRVAADAAFLPSHAAVSVDGAIRACFRCLVSGRHMLEWNTEVAVSSAGWWKSLFVLTFIVGSTMSLVLGMAVWLVQPESLGWSIPWLAAWFFAPVLGWYLDRTVVPRQKTYLLSDGDNRFLRIVARRTWRYFATFVKAETNWLPPDNYQVAHQDSLAMRTSPTNIGLWMTSVLGAYDSGYLSINQLVDRLSKTMATISRMQLHRGHLLNWYDIGTLAPLEPRYVSTVDSGNMLGCLWTLRQGLEEIINTPLLGTDALAGLTDTMELIKEKPAAENSYKVFRYC